VSRRGKSDAAPKQAAETTDPAVEEVLELTDEVGAEEPMPAHKTSRAPRIEAAVEDNSILSVESEVAARHSLSTLSSMLVTPKDGEDNTLDGLVRAMLKPMLKEWLDARLPALVEDMVAKEIARITAR
jgi:cell pole-organizing protein PopZ